MVSVGPGGGEDGSAAGRSVADRRGQLVLAGSVAIAVVVVGVAVLLNAGTYTDAATVADRPGEATATAERYRQVVEADLRRLVDATGGAGPPAEAALRRNVSTYGDRIGRSAAASAGASIDLRLVDASPPEYAFVFTFDAPSLHYRTTIEVRGGTT